MSERARRIVHWSPRVLGILYALFISLFAFDVWEMPGSIWYRIGAFFIHLAPVYVIAAAVIIGWKWPRAGAISFFVLAVAFTLFFGWRDPVAFILLAGPPILVGALFWLDAASADPEPRTT